VIDGKARLVKEIYCDGLGACLDVCPRDALTIEEREAEPFDEAATEAHRAIGEDIEDGPNQQTLEPADPLPCACPGSLARELNPPAAAAARGPSAPTPSGLRNWPVQLRLVSPQAPYLRQADVLLVADCVPFAFADFHATFLGERPVLIACPKLDDANYYVEKLTDLVNTSGLRSLTVVHMEVPCCSGLTRIAEAAWSGRAGSAAPGKDIPLKDITISIQGEVLETRDLK